MKDRLILSIYVGSIAALLTNLFLYIINSFIPGPRINMPQLTVQLLIEQVEYTVLVIVLGIIWSMIVGGLYTFIYLLILDFTGWNHLLLKAVAVVSGLWLFMAGSAMKIFEIFPEARTEPLAVMVFFVAHLFFAGMIRMLVDTFQKRLRDYT